MATLPAATLLKSDLLDYASYTVTTTGEKCTRGFLVQISAPTGTIPDAPACQVAAASCSGIPQVTSVHPYNSNLIVSSVVPSPFKGEDGYLYLVLVHYEVKSFDNSPVAANAFSWVTVSGTVENQEQFVDKDGKPLLVPWSGSNLLQPNSVQVTVCNAIVTMTRYEPPPMDLGRILTYVGAVNSVTWLNGNPRTWKCISIEPQWVGKIIKWTYKFQYNRNTWDIVCYYKDPITRNIVDGTLSEGNGYKTFRVYTEMDFGSGLTLP